MPDPITKKLDTAKPDSPKLPRAVSVFFRKHISYKRASANDAIGPIRLTTRSSERSLSVSEFPPAPTASSQPVQTNEKFYWRNPHRKSSSLNLGLAPLEDSDEIAIFKNLFAYIKKNTQDIKHIEQLIKTGMAKFEVDAYDFLANALNADQVSALQLICSLANQNLPPDMPCNPSYQAILDWLWQQQNQQESVNRELAIVCNQMKLIESGLGHFDINERFANNHRPLTLAAAYGHISLFNLFLANKADWKLRKQNPNTQSSEEADTILILASKENHLAIVKRILEIEEFDINTTSNPNNSELGYTALTAAAEAGNIEVVLALLKDPRTNLNVGPNRDVLRVAITAGKDKVVAELLKVEKLEKNAINKKPNLSDLSDNFQKHTPLTMAIYEGHSLVVKTMLMAKEVQLWPNSEGHSPYIIAIERFEAQKLPENLDILIYLLLFRPEEKLDDKSLLILQKLSDKIRDRIIAFSDVELYQQTKGNQVLESVLCYGNEFFGTDDLSRIKETYEGHHPNKREWHSASEYHRSSLEVKLTPKPITV